MAGTYFQTSSPNHFGLLSFLIILHFCPQEKDLPLVKNLCNARPLLFLGDSVTTDHISPAGSIARNSPAARYLSSRGLVPREFNSYGSRRGNDAIMARGTFANIRLLNKFIGRAAPRTIHIPSNDIMDVFDAAARYKEEGTPLIIIAGKDYGSGSSRDWAAKGPWMQVNDFICLVEDSWDIEIHVNMKLAPSMP